MEYKKRLKYIFSVVLVELLVLNCARTSRAYPESLSADETDDAAPQISWVFTNPNDNLIRVKREGTEEENSISHMNPKCWKNLHRLCVDVDSNDELALLECIQTLKPTEVSGIDNDCYQAIYEYIKNITNNQNIKRLAAKACGKELDDLDCRRYDNSHDAYLSCLIDNRDNFKNPPCITYVQRLEWIAVSDIRIITQFDKDCKHDINEFKCDIKYPYRDISQGQILACLQENINKLQSDCKHHILYISEVQADNVRLDKQLYMACMDDRDRFCPHIRPGHGQVYKCLMQHKMDRSMTAQCQEQLTRREKVIASDYKVSKGLVKACKEDIRTNHCKRFVSDDKGIRLAQILLCLESAIKNGSKIDGNCQAEMFDHRKLLMEDYRLSPEIVDGCAKDITMFCNNLELGGVTIHCLMEHTRPRKKKLRVSVKCQRAVNI